MAQGAQACEGSGLTLRERGVLDRILLGETNKEIAASLGCSVKTVEFHVTNILKKTQAESRLQLAVEMLGSTQAPKPQPTERT